MVFVSVLIASYNHELYLTEAIESVLNQTFKDFELIIIDDYSIDNSRCLIKKYEKEDNRIRAVFHDFNKGPMKTVNESIEMAKGKYIAFLNSDDAWEKTKLEKQLKVLENDENLIVWTEGKLIDKNSIPIGKTFTEWHGTEKKKKSGNIFEELLKLQNFLFFSSLILKKDLLGKIRFNPSFKIMGDYAFEVDLAKRYKYYFIDTPLTKYRIHGKNTSDNRTGMIFDLINHINYFLKAYGNDISRSTKINLYNRMRILSNGLGANLKGLPQGFEIDLYKYLYGLKHESKRLNKTLLKEQNARIILGLYRLYRNSVKSFIEGFAIFLKFKKIQLSISFWLNFTIFFFSKLILKK